MGLLIFYRGLLITRSNLIRALQFGCILLPHPGKSNGISKTFNIAFVEI